MAMFLPVNKLSSVRSLLNKLGRSQTWKRESKITSVAGAASSLAGGSSDGVIPEVALQSKAAGERYRTQAKNKSFWMRDPATGNWIPEDHFGDTDAAELRAKLLSSGK